MGKGQEEGRKREEIQQNQNQMNYFWIASMKVMSMLKINHVYVFLPLLYVSHEHFIFWSV